MCYINGLRVSLIEFVRYKQSEKDLKALHIADVPAQKGFDYGVWPVIKPSADGKNWDIVHMEWGFLPYYLKNAEAVYKFRHGYKDEKEKFHPPLTTLNAMGEEFIKLGKMFREAGLQRRCLVLSSEFYEHRHVFPLNKRTGLPLKTPLKYPYRISIPTKPVFMMAGIYQSWTDKETGEIIDTFAILTTEANSLMAQIHNTKNRMPVIFTDALADEWTNSDLSEERMLKLASFQFPSELMDAHTIRKSFLEEPDPTLAFNYPDLAEINTK